MTGRRTQRTRHIGAARRVAVGAFVRAVESGDEGAVSQLSGARDPLVCWKARRHVNSALRRAWLEVDAARGMDLAAVTRHVLQVGCLIAARADVREPMLSADAADRMFEEVTEALGKTSPPRRWFGTPLMILVVASLVVMACIWTRPKPDPLAHPVGRALAVDMAAWLVDLDGVRFASTGATGYRHADTELDEARDRIVSEEAAELMGAEAAERLQRALDAVLVLVRDGWAKERTDGLFAAVRALNESLNERDLPYYVSADAVLQAESDRPRAALFTFHIEAEREVTAGQRSVRVVHLRRLDALNWLQPVLGYTSRSIDEAVVRRDLIEQLIVTVIGPALVDDAGMAMLELDERRFSSKWQNALRARAGEVARQAWWDALPGHASELAELGALLRERRDLLIRSQSELIRRWGVMIRQPAELVVPTAHLDELEWALGELRGAELIRIQDQLASDRFVDLVDAMVKHYAASVERHEVQHRLDYAGDALAIPEPLGVFRTGSFGRRTTHELSAYTAELADVPSLVRLNLMLLARRCLGSQITPESMSAGLIVKALAADFGLAEPDHPWRKRRVAARTIIALSNIAPVRLSAAAGRLWKRWFGRELVLVDRPDRWTVAEGGP